MVLRRDRGLVSDSRTRRKTPEQRAPYASRTNRRGPERRNRANDWKLGTWNCKSLNFDGSDRILFDELRVRSLDVVALQEVCWKGKDQRNFGEYSIYWSGGNSHELGTGFIVLGEMKDRVIDWKPVGDRLCRLRIRGRSFNVSIINAHSPHMGSDADDKDAFYELLEREYRKCPKHDVKIVIGDMNAQVGQEVEFRPVIGRFSAHQATNENGLRLIDFATSKNMAIRSTYFQHNLLRKFTWRSPNDRESQIDHVLIDGRHFSDIIDVKTYRGANIDSDHYLVVAKLRQRLSDINKIRYRRPQRYNLERLKIRQVAAQYAQELEAALPEEDELLEAPLEDCWRRTEAAINEAASSTIGYVERVRRNGWFDEECQEILSEKNAARAVWLQRNLRGNKESYKRLKRQQTHLFRDKKRRLEELECQDMEQLYRSNETRKFYKCVGIRTADS